MSIAFPELVDKVKADFAARNITAQVLFGDWELAKHNAGNRVVIGVASTFEDAADLGPANTPGQQDLGNATEAARTLYTMAEYAQVWCHSAPVGDEKDPERQKKTHRATMALVKQTIRAMFRAAPGAFGWGQGQVLKPEASEFRFGAVATFRAMLLTPVLDDAWPIRKADGYSAEVYAVMPNDGEVLVGTVEKEIP